MPFQASLALSIFAIVVRKMTDKDLNSLVA